MVRYPLLGVKAGLRVITPHKSVSHVMTIQAGDAAMETGCNKSYSLRYRNGIRSVQYSNGAGRRLGVSGKMLDRGSTHCARTFAIRSLERWTRSSRNAIRRCLRNTISGDISETEREVAVKHVVTSSVALVLASLVSTAPVVAQTYTVTLDEAVALALQVNPSMVQARGAVTTAGWTKRQAIGNWLPTLSANSSVSTNSSERFDAATQRSVSGSSTSYSAGFSASMTIFDGLGRAAENRAASADFESADASLVDQRFQTMLQTKQSFFAALAAEELVRVSETRIQRAEEQLKIARGKLAAGSGTRSDTLSSRVELANAELQRVNAETALATAKAGLARLIGVEGDVQAVGEGRFRELAFVDTTGLRTEAIARSPAIEQADAAARAASAQIAVSRAQYFPSINASYSNSYAGSEISNLSNSWSLRMSLSWPIFNGFSRELNQSRSAVNRDVALAQAEDSRRQVNADLTQYVASLTSARTRLTIAQTSRAAADEDLRVQRERYRLGAATTVDVLVSQVNLDQAEVDIVQARFDYFVAKAQIEALIGREL